MQDTEHSLTQLAALERGGPLLVRLQDGRLAEPTGQLRLAFEAPPDPQPALPRVGFGADEWFELGVSREEQGLLEQAVEAYRQALLAGGRKAEVCFNMGNTLYALGRKQEAVRELEQATCAEPDYVEAWNNLGNVLCDLGRADEARAAYGRALAIAPDYADAHYNTAELLFTGGDLDGSRRHFQAYLSLDPGSSWAEVVRRRLAELTRLLERGPGRIVPLRPIRERDGTT
jgi:tetratricopeptide (TPR) repeat protein